MAIQAQPGYITDPNNPNAVVRDPNNMGASTALAQNTGISIGATNPTGSPSPVPQTPVQTPVTQPQAPQTAPAGPTSPSAPPTGTQVVGQPQNSAQTGALTMPANGSVVDLLNMAGQDSSYAARQQLAQQYGIANYQGTAQQNTELSKKYLEAFNANKGKAVPQSGAQASSALDAYLQGSEKELTPQDPTRSFMDSYASMDPIQASIFQQVSGLLSSTQNQQSLTDFYKQEVQSQGIEALNTELLDLNRIMEGTEDDVRDEITKAGGFATESQVQGMVAARNKTLLKKASFLQAQLDAKNDYVDRIVSLTQADRKQVSEDLDRKLGLTKTLFDMSQQMTNNAKENYKMIVDSVGWEGLAKSLGGNKAQTAQVEKLFGMAPGELQALAAYKKPLTEKETLDLENQKLQNQKLRQDIGKGPEVQTQVVEVNGKKVLINSKTGQTIATIGGDGVDQQTAFQAATAQQKVADITGLLDDSYLTTAVGTNPLGRASPFELFTGGKSNFIGGVQNLLSTLTKDNLINAKANGATFGALSEGELGLLSSSATKLSSPAWTVTDDVGNIIGWKVSEPTFKAELDKINNFAKLDYILKGGDPTSLPGVRLEADGTISSINSDRSVTKLK